MRIYLPGRGGFIRQHCLQSLLERGHREVGPTTCDAILDVRGPSRPQDFIDGRFDIGQLLSQTTNLLEIAAERRVPFILLSSTDVLHNNNPYTALKLAQEAAVEAYGMCFALSAHCVRSSCVFGPGMDERRFVILAAKAILAGKPVTVHVTEDGPSTRYWTWAPALAEALVLAVEGRGAPASYTNWLLNARQMAQAIARALNKELITRDESFYEDNPGHFSAPMVGKPVLPPGVDLDVAIRRTLHYHGILQ